jgi:uracil-DNA glycosylase family 4
VPIGGVGVALLGEAPGETEEERGQPFTGPSARLLHASLHNLGIVRSSLWIANVVSCRPPKSDINSFEGREAIACCASGLKAELARMRLAGIRVIVPLGQLAMDALGIEGRINKSRGSVFKVAGFHVIPTYHPAFLLSGGGRRGSDGVNHIAAFQSDLQKAVAVARDGWEAPREVFELEPTLADVKAFVTKCLAERVTVAVDIETTGLDARRGARPVVIGLADSAHHALIVPLLTLNGERYWSPEEEPVVKSCIEILFAAGRLLFQNCFFDIPFLANCGWRISVDNVLHDTLVVHSLVSPETEHNLGYIVSVYGQTPEWKEDFKNRSLPILQMDQLEMRRYNARDCVVLHQVIKPMLEQLDEYGLTEFYNSETHPLMRPFMEMNTEGVGFDFRHMEAFTRRINELLSEKEKAIREAYHLPQEFNFDSDDEIRWLLFRQRPGKFSQLKSCLITYEKQLKDRVKVDTKLIVGYDTVDVPVDLLPEGKILDRQIVHTMSHKRAGTAAYDELRGLAAVEAIPELYRLPSFRGISTDGGKTKVSKDGLLSYRIALQNRLEALDALKTPRPAEQEAIVDVLDLIELLGRHGEFSKLKTSFTSYMPHADGRIRPSWLMHGTATGRLSCIVGGTPVLTRRGWLPIEDILIGDYVRTHRNRWRRVADVLDQGHQECIRLTTSTGRDIICTSDHLMWTPAGWLQAQEAKDVYISTCPERQGTDPTGTGTVSRLPGEAVSKPDRHSTRDNRTQCHGDCAGECLCRTAQGGEEPTHIPATGGQQRLQLGQERATTPQLEGGMLRQEGISDNQAEWETGVCPSCCHGRSFGTERTPEAVSGSSYRWQRREQLTGQSSALHQERSWTSSQEVETVAGKSYVGELPVYDLEVDEDHSFVANGFVVHNCKAPNLAQLPSRGEGSDVRKFFVARPGWSIVDADFEGAEIALLGYESGDDVLIDIYESGKNIHDENTKILFGIDDTDPLWSEARKAAKVFQFGGLSYGGGDREIYKKVLMASPKLPLTFDKFVKAKEAWMDAHPKYVIWKDDIVERVSRDRRLYNAFGRMRIFLGSPRDIIKEGMNFMIQSAGACLINRAMIRIYDRIRAEGLDTRIIMQVYDEIVLEAPDEQVDASRTILIEEMQRPFMMRGRQCMIRAEAGVGKTYGDAK